MANDIVKDFPWCEIQLLVSQNRIFLQQKWKYTWLLDAGESAWTQNEKEEFHRRADRSIWAAWSNKAKMKVSGTHPFTKTILPINLDIRWVTSGQHWSVNVTKVASGTFKVSNVVWNSRIINLDTNDFSTRSFNHATAPLRTAQTPVAHEFGHAAGNTAVLNRGDEYRATHPNHADHGSIMHSGSQLRVRHFRTIVDEMNTMIPGCTFSVDSV